MLLSCTSARSPEALTDRFLGTDGVWHPIPDPQANFTVVEFFSAHCPCQAQHDERLRDLAARYRERGVVFVAIDSEADATPTRDAAQAIQRGYPYALLTDSEGAAARALYARYATYSLLVNRSGQVLFRGGIDSDRVHLRDDRIAYLEDAIEDALASRPVRRPLATTLGCSLMLKAH